LVIACAVCPQAPALVPEVGQGIAAELADVRAAALEALRAVITCRPDRMVVLASADSAGPWDESAGGTFRGFGPDVRAGGRQVVLPASLTVGAWLLDVVGWTGPRAYVTQAPRTAGGDGWLVMADGSSRHRRLAPEWTDTDGRAFDASIAKALEAGDADALASLDVEAAAEYGAAGIGGLVVLGETMKGAEVEANLRFNAAPFGVGYWVADWTVG
jgi:hypothetical protein